MLSFTRVFFGIWSLIFVVFALLQFNDPDPEIWVTIYGLAAIMCALAVLGKFHVPTLLLISTASFIGGMYLFPTSVSDWIIQEWQQADLTMKTVDMEEARESFGLLIVSVITGFATYIGLQEKRSIDKSQIKVLNSKV